MSLKSGKLFPYVKYRDHFDKKAMTPVIWEWKKITVLLESYDHSERGSLTLSGGDAAAECEIIPGCSITLQVVKPGKQTRPHAHSWWHLYSVQQGMGQGLLGSPVEKVSLSRGDLLLVPGWCPHAFENFSSHEDLIFMVLGNLPQQASLANLLANEPENFAVPAFN